MNRTIVLILHDIRSCHNVGSLLRTAEGIGVQTVYMSGYTPYPHIPNDTRLPHIYQKISKQINKTALDAENSVEWRHHQGDVADLLDSLKANGYELCALEQSKSSVTIDQYKPTAKIAILLGREVEGITEELLSRCDSVVEIPMLGKKESFNVVQAAAMLLYRLRFLP